jgi:hypothetical protein
VLRRHALLALLIAPLRAQETGGGAGADPARFFPADTFAYAEVDASALEACLPEWQIAKILTDPALLRVPGHLTGAAIALRHDKDGLVLDCFSPVGLLVPSALLAGTLAVRAPLRVVPMPARAAMGRASLGIRTRTRDGASVKVLALAPAGPAAAAGFQQGDRIVGLGGAAIGSIEDLDRELEGREPGESVEVKILRGDTEMTLTVELGAEEEDMDR